MEGKESGGVMMSEGRQNSDLPDRGFGGVEGADEKRMESVGRFAPEERKTSGGVKAKSGPAPRGGGVRFWVPSPPPPFLKSESVRITIFQELSPPAGISVPEPRRAVAAERAFFSFERSVSSRGSPAGFSLSSGT